MRLNRKRIKHTILIINTLNYINYERTIFTLIMLCIATLTLQAQDVWTAAGCQYTLRFLIGTKRILTMT